jgi:Zn-dependent M28 family amino/carboxypeptidase
MRMRRSRIALTTVPLAALALSLAAVPAQADNGTATTALQHAVTLDGVTSHLAALQAIADDNGGNRAAGTLGHVKSAEYVYDLLDEAGYEVSMQHFSYAQFKENKTPELEQTAPNQVAYVHETDFYTMDYSGPGNVTSGLQAVDLLFSSTGGSTSGCEADDFVGFDPGSIALLQRGTCTFVQKAQNAQTAGATGVIIFNEGNTPDREGVLFGTLGDPDVVSIPVVGASFALGKELATLVDQGSTSVRLMVAATTEIVETDNVLADTPTGRSDRIVVAGGHLDSVREGPGIEDNGTGTAATLEVALQMADLGIKPRNKVRFAFWSGEEDGLLGSAYYVGQLSPRDIKSHALNLNFDMIGSPNFVRFVYDGDGSDTGASGPNGSGIIEKVFTDYFAAQGLPVEATEFDGRSDYGPFIDAGIPAGGLFTGAEGIMTDEQAKTYEGVAGEPYDPCYHQACDDIDNLSLEVLDQMSDAVAHAVQTFAMTTSAVNGTGQGSGAGSADMDRKGARFTK